MRDVEKICQVEKLGLKFCLWRKKDKYQVWSHEVLGKTSYKKMFSFGHCPNVSNIGFAKILYLEQHQGHIVWCLMVLHGIAFATHNIAWYCMILQAIACFCLQCIACYCMVTTGQAGSLQMAMSLNKKSYSRSSGSKTTKFCRQNLFVAKKWSKNVPSYK